MSLTRKAKVMRSLHLLMEILARKFCIIISREEMKRLVSGVFIGDWASEALIVASIVYIVRFCDGLPFDSKGHNDCLQRVLTTSILIASKFFDDHSFNNRACLGTIVKWLSLAEIAKMERQFLACINYNLVIKYTEWQKIYNKYII